MDFGEVYSAKGGASFFEDLLAATGLTIRGANQPAALERLAEHAEQSAKRGELMARRAHRALSDLGIEARGEGGIHARALSNTAGQGGEFLVPAWMTERFASVARRGAAQKARDGRGSAAADLGAARPAIRHRRRRDPRGIRERQPAPDPESWH